MIFSGGQRDFMSGFLSDIHAGKRNKMGNCP